MADTTGYDEAEYDIDDQKDADRASRWATVALSVGLSTLASAVVIGVGAAVMFANANDGQVTVVQGDGTANAAGVTSKKDSNTTTATRATTAAKSTTTSSASSGESVVVNGGGVPEPVDTDDSSQSDSSSDIPAQPSNAELKNQMETILAEGASDETIASNLENPAGVQTIRDAGVAMRAVPIFQYDMVDPVVVNGDQMTATIQMKMIGIGEKPPADLYYVAKGGKWVLTDESVCLIAQQARVSCSVG